MTTIPQFEYAGKRCAAKSCRTRCAGVGMVNDFAVGFSRQPLPNGRHFASITNTGAAGVLATDASTCHRFDLAILRPETVEPFRAKLPPTATNFNLSTAEEARVGRKEIANGVKQQLSGAWPLGVEIFRTAHSPGYWS
jgi:hypothetical protein